MKKKNEIVFNQTLKNLMQSSGMNVKGLSRESGIPQSTISSYIGAVKASYDPSHLHSLSELFGVSIEFLLFGKERENHKALNALLTEKVFSGYLKVNIERVIPDKKEP